jgi:acetylornithine deacetylase/succinyl-diaminopimelate desuccinylase-like protein
MSALLDLTSDLIRRRSLTPDDAGCQALIAARLEAAGMRCESMRFGDVDNLWAVHVGDATGPTLVLLGHTDVVPPGPVEDWSSDPFTPDVRGGLLFGRGAADMKASVAAFVVALERFVAAHPDHRGTVALLLTSDEEGDAIDGLALALQPPGFEHDAPRRRDADRRRAAHGKIADRARDRIGIGTVDVDLFERQTPLVEQAQHAVAEDDGADRVVAGGFGHRR